MIVHKFINNCQQHLYQSTKILKNFLSDSVILFKNTIIDGGIVVVELSKFGFYSLKNRITKNPIDQTKATECWKKMLKAKHIFEPLNKDDIRNFLDEQFPRILKEEANNRLQNKAAEDKSAADRKA